MQSPDISLMRPDEADDVAALILHANAENLAAFPPAIAEGYRNEIVRIAGRLSGAETYVAVLDGEVVGTVSLVTDAGDDGHPWPPNGAVIRFLAVAPHQTGRKLGSRLTEACIERARALGVAFIGLHTAPVMTAARRIYEQAGFVRAPDHDFSPAAHYGDADPADPPWGLAYVLRLD